jgi:hypothetical protein
LNCLPERRGERIYICCIFLAGGRIGEEKNPSISIPINNGYPY